MCNGIVYPGLFMAPAIDAQRVVAEVARLQMLTYCEKLDSGESSYRAMNNPVYCFVAVLCGGVCHAFTRPAKR